MFPSCSWCCPEYWVRLWSASNESRGINCGNICSHSFVWIRHLLRLWRRYARCSRAHLPWCIWWTFCRRMQCADRSISTAPIPNARANSTARWTIAIRPSHHPIMGYSLMAFITGTNGRAAALFVGSAHVNQCFFNENILKFHFARDLSCPEVMGIFKYILIASSVFNFTGFLLCCILLILLCVRQKRVKRVPYCTATSRNRL